MRPSSRGIAAVRVRDNGDSRPTVLPLAVPSVPGAAVDAPLAVLAFAALSLVLVVAALWYLRLDAVAEGERLTGTLSQVIAEQTTRSLQTVDQRLHVAAEQLGVLRAQGALTQDSARTMLRGQLEGLPFVRA